MTTYTNSARRTIGSLIALALAATLSLGVAPSPATAQTELAVVAGTIAFDAIEVYYEGEGCSVEGPFFDCPDWAMAGAILDPLTMSADIDDFVPGVHLVLSSFTVTFPSGCQITGPNPILLDWVEGTSYHYNGDFGEYYFTSCSFTEVALFTQLLGTSPSTTNSLVAFEIDHI